MKITCLLFLLLTMNVNSEEKDIQEVKNTISNLFEQFSMQKTEDLKLYCANDIQILEHGAVWNLDSLTSVISKIKNTDYRRINKFDFLKFNVDGDNSWVNYYNEAEITKSGQRFHKKWIETAVLKKINGTWKITVLHSTIIENKKL